MFPHKGDILQWEQQVRLRHMTTRKYLCIDGSREILLIDDCEDPRTVFRLHSVINERDEIRFESYCRIEHVLSGFWLHALKDEDYIRRKFRDIENVNDQTLKGLRWDSAMVRQVSASGESQYDDAFTIQMVEDEHVDEFNYVAGMVPFLRNLIKDRQQGVILNSKKTHQLLTQDDFDLHIPMDEAMEELRKYMLMKSGLPSKNRQKLMRNLKVIDLLVRILQFPLEGVPDEQNIILVFKEAYEILYTYMIGKSRKNALYFAKYIEFFQTQFTQKGGIGLNVAQMIVELIRDKRKIVDRISHSQIDEFVSLLQCSQVGISLSQIDEFVRLLQCSQVGISLSQIDEFVRLLQCSQFVRLLQCSQFVRLLQCNQFVRLLKYSQFVRLLQCSQEGIADRRIDEFVRLLQCSQFVRLLQCSQFVRLLQCSQFVRLLQYSQFSENDAKNATHYKACTSNHVKRSYSLTDVKELHF
ncbi:hypothetical protein DPMN_126252 [Dreissena polymorpha]|uniref:RIH domain-containing protein n=1 Tax=Dreissena polymorpha TaxID=45954 RepID=A0A9D4GVC9_DREPO|nr:hypothetical protein DPMN_126252 [Dreissena polymorpha]